MKQQIQRKLVAAMLVELCTHSERLFFRDAWCTQELVIRFTTPFFRGLFPVANEESGKWKTGDTVMYEVMNGTDSFVVSCVLSGSPAAKAEQKKRDVLLQAAGVKDGGPSSDVVLKSWDLTRSGGNVNKLLADFENLINKEIPRFEQELQERIAPETPQEQMTEGAEETVALNKYERNPKARAACIAAYGTACCVCGMDFGKAYGPEFAGKIEVHHIVPISEIGGEYVVDPIRDLRPVCPNCHMALHSKKDGVYTIEELKAIRTKQAR